MKFEDLLMEGSEEQQRRVDLQEEVKKLKAELSGEQALNRVLRFALQGPVSTHPSLSLLVPPQVQVLLEELAMVEEEIIWLERKVEELKLSLYQEREQNREREIENIAQDSRLPCGLKNGPLLSEQRSRSQNYDECRKEKIRKERRPSLGSVSEILTVSSTRSHGKLKIFSRKNVHKPRDHTRG